jgi:hypothetical protein
VNAGESGGGASGARASGGGVRPEDAAASARASAERKRADGVYPPDTIADSGAPAAGPDLARLREWAIIEVDPTLLYSTRKGGAPITWFKRMLLRLMRQYTTELEAQQTRFNVGVVAYLESREQDKSE